MYLEFADFVHFLSSVLAILLLKFLAPKHYQKTARKMRMVKSD